MDKNPKSILFGETRRIFTAGMMANVMYLMVAAAFASKFFADFKPWLKYGMTFAIILFAVGSVLIYPAGRAVKEE